MPMSPRLLRPRASGGAFTPRSIAGLGLWLDATDASSYTESSGQISEWRDKSGNGRNFEQTTANNRPTLFTSSGNVQTATPATINGVQGFFFEGVNDQLIGNAASLSILANAPGCTAFIASRWLGTGGNGGTIFGIGGRTAVSVYNTPTGGIYKSASRDGTPQVGLQNGGTIITSTNYVFRHLVNYEAGTHSAFASGTLAGSAGTPGGGTGLASSANASDFRIGAIGANSSFYIGIVGEVIVYQRTLTASEIERVEKNYLAVKWGITVA